MSPSSVLMVVGAYSPEVSGGGLQCRTLVRALQGQVRVVVLATSTDPTLSPVDEVDGIPVYRVAVNRRKPATLIGAAWRLARRCDIVHFHGFSRKTVLCIALAKLLRKPVMLKLTLVGEDDPESIRRQGRLAWWCYRQVDCFVGVSDRLRDLYRAAGMPEAKFRLIPNGVDTDRFRPVEDEERLACKAQLQLRRDLPVMLFVGIFSPRKHPEVLLDAWTQLALERQVTASLVFVGGTNPHCAEVDWTVAKRLQTAVDALPAGLRRHVVFVETTTQIERYYQAADVFILPSKREGLPNALLEAMASGLPCIATRLPGITDTLIAHGTNGLLLEQGGAGELAMCLRELLADRTHAQALGRAARRTIEQRFAIQDMTQRYMGIYHELTTGLYDRRKRHQVRVATNAPGL